MSRYRVLPRRNHGTETEKCPICRIGFTNFGDESKPNEEANELFCISCGNRFFSKKFLIEFRKGVAEQIKKQQAEKAAGIKEQIQKQEAEAKIEVELPPKIDATFKCDICGKEVKTALALNGHLRSHKPEDAA